MPSVIATTFTAQELCDLLAPEIARRVAQQLEAQHRPRRRGRGQRAVQEPEAPRPEADPSGPAGGAGS